MTSTFLPDDCIYDILKHLQNYNSTLFNCLLVNRFWCKATAPLLYANPFANVNVNATTNKKNYKIIFTLIICFNKTKILQFKNKLKSYNIDKIDDIDLNDINDEYKPLFEYPKYLENYDLLKINNIIFEWFKTFLNLPYKHEFVKYFIPTFHQSNLNQSINIKQLNISLYLLNNNKYDIQIFISILKNLNSLNLHNVEDNENTQEFLNNIINTCFNLKKLEIGFAISPLTSVTNIKEKLCTMIQKQNSLKIFKMSLCVYDILSSLESQKDSLVYIEFEDVNFNNISFKNLINLYNLKYLKFRYCRGVTLTQCKNFNFVSFKLKELMFERNSWDKNDIITPSMIKYLGESLEELVLITSNLNCSTIENISLHCLNLITLGIKINSHIDPSTFPYFKDLKIRILNFNISDINRNNADLSEASTNLANNLSNDVKEISIHFHYYFNFHNYLYFEKFLENCHNGLEIINLYHFIELEILKIILNYIERSNNSLKFFGVTKLEKVLNYEESKLLDKIKAKGVKIVDFNSIHKQRTFQSMPI